MSAMTSELSRTSTAAEPHRVRDAHQMRVAASPDTESASAGYSSPTTTPTTPATWPRVMTRCPPLIPEPAIGKAFHVLRHLPAVPPPPCPDQGVLEAILHTIPT